MPRRRPSPPGVPVLDVVIPVYNEQAALADSVRRLHRYLSESFLYQVRITIADNASCRRHPASPRSWRRNSTRRPRGAVEEKGRGRALHHVWSQSDAMVLAYMDVDLSTDLAAVSPLVAAHLRSLDLSIGTRLGRGSRVVRGPKREFTLRCYNLILRSTLHARFSDAQCGFKAICADVAHRLLPHVADTGWFFDTELLVLAERSGLRIHQVPVDWVDDLDSRVDIIATATADLKGVGRAATRLRQRFDPGERHCRATGSVAVVRRRTQFAVPPGGAVRCRRRAVDRGLPAVVHGAASAGRGPRCQLRRAAGDGDRQHRGQPPLHVRRRRHDEGRATPRRGAHRLRHRLAITSGALAGLHAFVDQPHRMLELSVLVLANLLATAVRFVLLRGWVFHPRRTR